MNTSILDWTQIYFLRHHTFVYLILIFFHWIQKYFIKYKYVLLNIKYFSLNINIFSLNINIFSLSMKIHFCYKYATTTRLSQNVFENAKKEFISFVPILIFLSYSFDHLPSYQVPTAKWLKVSDRHRNQLLLSMLPVKVNLCPYFKHVC